MSNQATGIFRGMDSIALHTGRRLEREMEASRQRSETRVERSWSKVGKAMRREIDRRVTR
ncbi:hypothetical protein [uncultured Gordonia sp.]|uniref:hypothetical protein n=1 Tax=uncultured Gordonia sp. TaxID=198437 RepID=UPI00258EE0AF|nr:hypothetical protein [uncultured Gordonia sp.]